MADEFIDINYSVEDIERYLQGRMSAREMHSLERAALRDPFLADAIEGYRHEPFVQTYQHLNEISAAILGERQQAKIVALPVKANYWWAAAVAFGAVVVAGAALWVIQRSNGQNDQHIVAAALSKQKTQAAPAAPEQKEPTANIAENAKRAGAGLKKHGNAVPDEQGDSTETVKLEFEPALPQPTNLTKTGAPKLGDSVNAPETDVALNRRAAGLAVQSHSVNALAPVPAAADSLGANRDTSVMRVLTDAKRFYGDNIVSAKSGLPSPPPGLNKPSAYTLGYGGNNLVKFEGFVVDDFNKKPLNSALVYTGKGKQMAVTDSNGYFRFNALDSQLVVQVSSVGYETKQVQLKNNTRNYIAVAPATASLSAVEIVAFGIKKKTAKKLPVDSLFPEGGWPSFREYVYKRLHKENEMDTTGNDIIISGSVEIEFTIDERGLATDLKITKSLNKKIDAKVLEVVQQWPGWVAGRKDKKAKVVIDY